MTFGQALVRRVSVVGGALALALVTERPALAEESVALNVVEFETQTRNQKGVVRCGLFKEGGWLKDAFRASIVSVRKTANDKTVARCVFKEVPAGVYGISAFHDEDNDGKLNTNIVGYPTEQYCASNDARNMFSAPSWSDAKFKYKGGAVRLKGNMK